MKLLLSSLLFCCCFLGEHYGQGCGTQYSVPPRGWEQQLQQNYARSSQSIEVLLKIHIVRRSDGTGGISAEDILLGVNNMNALFQQAMDMTFKICPDIHYIDNTTLYNNEVDQNVLDNFFYPSRVSHAIDIFYAPITNPVSDGFIASWAEFPWMSGDCIVMHNEMAKGNTLAHEMGHHLGLYHTHHHTDLLVDPIPNNHNTNAVEYVDGTGCTSRGDRICDTPADHGLGGRVSSDGQGNNCIYTGANFYDLNGDLFVPNIFNVMSYTNDDCRNMFSQDQAQRALSVLQTYKIVVYSYSNQACPCEEDPNSWIFEEVNYVGCKENISIWSTINTLPIIKANNRISAQNVVSNTANVIYEAGQNINLEPGFKVELGGVFKTRNQSCTLMPCSSPSAPYTPTVVTHLNAALEPSIITKIDNLPNTIQNLKCYPNPANNSLNVLFNVEELGTTKLELMDVNGRVLVELVDEQLKTGEQSYQLNTEVLAAGVYMLVVRTNNEVQTKKVLIQH